MNFGFLKVVYLLAWWKQSRYAYGSLGINYIGKKAGSIYFDDQKFQSLRNGGSKDNVHFSLSMIKNPWILWFHILLCLIPIFAAYYCCLILILCLRVTVSFELFLMIHSLYHTSYSRGHSLHDRISALLRIHEHLRCLWDFTGLGTSLALHHFLW